MIQAPIATDPFFIKSSLLLNIIKPALDMLLIPEQAGFGAKKTTTSQVSNLTQLHIEDVFKEW